MGAECRCGPSPGDSTPPGPEPAKPADNAGPAACYKCGGPAAVRTREDSCRECFLKAVSRDFRANLRTKCLKKHSSRVIAAIWDSGGPAATALLHLILSRNNDRHLRLEGAPSGPEGSAFGPEFRRLTDSDDMELRLIVHVQGPLEAGALASCHEARLGALSAVFEQFTRRFATDRALEADSVVESALGCVTVATLRGCHFLHGGGSAEPCGDACREFEETLTGLWREDADAGLYAWRAARTLSLRGYLLGLAQGVHVLSPETQDELCRDAVTLTCLGVGDRASWQGAFVDAVSLGGALILRPLKTLSAKEVAFYHKFSGLSGAGQGQAVPAPNGSIAGCVAALADDAAAQHANTLHNVTKVLNRLVAGPLADCGICQTPSGADPAGQADARVCEACRFFGLRHGEALKRLGAAFADARRRMSHAQVPRRARLNY